MLKKLEAFGVEREDVEWTREWLRDRKNRVLIKGRKSGWRAVLSGVPQGSVLGPLLFVVYINDLEDCGVEGQLVSLFADDTKLVQSVETEEDAAKFQDTLDRLWQWTAKWEMGFNVEKCHVMHVADQTASKVPSTGIGAAINKINSKAVKIQKEVRQVMQD
ncbi:MAG: hypothetical protein FJ333_03980 [Sphingomonadales bacterium]|nr:hypothetical protein [Sphingomonadales bacterium]